MGLIGEKNADVEVAARVRQSAVGSRLRGRRCEEASIVLFRFGGDLECADSRDERDQRFANLSGLVPSGYKIATTRSGTFGVGVGAVCRSKVVEGSSERRAGVGDTPLVGRAGGCLLGLTI